MVFRFNNTWIDIVLLATALILLYLTTYIGTLKQRWSKMKREGFLAALRQLRKKLTRFCFWVALLLFLSAVFYLSVNRTFDRLIIADERILVYPWPKSEVHIPWPDVLEVATETKYFRKQ